MKRPFALKHALILGGLLFCASSALAQTTVTGTIADPNGVAYYPATVTACLTPPTVDPIVNGQHVNPNPGSPQPYCQTVQTVPSGAFQMALYANASISPGGTQWVFTVQTTGAPPPAGKGPQRWSSAPVTISGTSQDVSAAIASVGPTQLNSAGGGTVSTVFGRAGAVVAAANDYSVGQLSGLPITAPQGGTGVASPPARSIPVAEGASNYNFVTSPTVNGDYLCLFRVTASIAVDPTCPQTGLSGASGLTGATATYTVLFSDNATALWHAQGCSSPIAVALPTATSLTNSKFTVRWSNHCAVTDTLTPTTWTIQNGINAAAATLSIGPGLSCLIAVDPNSASNWLSDCANIGGASALPGAVSLTGQTAAIANGTTLCTNGACNFPGQYRVTAYFSCSVAGTGNIGFNLTFTDETGTKTAQTVPLDVAGATTLSATMLLTAANNSTGSASFWSSGAGIIGYGVTYTATGTYTARIVVERLQ